MTKKAAKKKTKKRAGKKKPARTPAREFTWKQEAFMAWYVAAEVDGNGTEAARRAGYKGTDAVLASVAAENLRKPHIRAEIDRRMAQALSGADVTVEAVLRRLAVIGAKALEAGKYGAAAKCAELHGKYLKMFTDRIEHVKSIEDVTDEELVRLLQEISEAGGVDLGQLLTGNGPEDSDVPAASGAPTTH